jgi:hypothetical protein
MFKTRFIPFLCSALLLFIASCQKDDVIENKVPVADAGASQTITLPVDSVKLTGTGNDADGKVVAYLWSQVSGPVAATIVNPGSPATSIRDLIAGSYIFQLMVTDDKGATGVDTAVVTVNPNPIKTLTLQPANNPTEYILNQYGSQNSGFVAVDDLPIAAWTKSSNTFNVRALLKFDLSSIPANSTIISANLYLYSYPPPTVNGNFTDANYGTDNTLLVQQVTSNWSTATTTWANQPPASTTNQVVVPTTTQSMLDLNLNVTPLISSMVSANANYGFLLRLQNEVTYNSRIFVSSHNTTHTTKYPKLVVVYK